MLDDILLQVNKPARYIGAEWNVSKKDFDQADIRFALCFPDLYEIGMSNLGIRIIYGLLNNIKDVCCERFFSPDIDMERLLRANQLEIFSLESKKGIKEFDLIGFSLGYELVYTNVLNILDLGRIPQEASLRDHTFPLVIGGGPCTLNPEPMHEFFDLFVIGEAEEVILEIIDVYRKFKQKFKKALITKQDLLIMLSKIEGVYAPSLYEAIYDPQGKIKEFKPKVKGLFTSIKKRFVKDLNRVDTPLDWLVPYIQTIHDRITLEVMRGCPNRCRFCQARSQYFPFRQKEVKKIINLASHIYKRTGYEEISLSGLSVSDYGNTGRLLEQLFDLFKEKAVSVSLPSLKPKTMVGHLSKLIATVKKTGLTFAPEAATKKLRDIIAKDFNEQDFLKAIEEAYLSGYQHIKLYFMIGLPNEEEEDLDAIVEFARRISELRRKIAQRPAQVNISINTLIPKPHTPLQWLKMEDLGSIKYKQDYLKMRILKNKKLRISFHNRHMSFLEGILSRGDRRLSKAVLSAFKIGARFDSWDNYFRLDRWQYAFSESNIDPDFYLKERTPDELLPWDFLDTGMSKKTLLAEFNKVSEATTYGTK